LDWLQDQWISVFTYITNSNMWINVGQAALKIIAIFILSGVFIRFGKSLIRNFVKIRSKTPLRITERRQMTMVKLLENVLTYFIYFASLLMVLESVNIPIGSLLAGAGILGLAVGFGAQNLVRDIITGFFIIFEDQFSVGDYVKIGSHEGFVEEIGLRTTKVKSWTGELHILPNGSINEVTNYSIHNSISVVDVSIAYEGNIPKAEQVIEELLQELPVKYEDMLNPPELLGVQNLGSSDVVLRVIAEVKPMSHWKMARALRKELKLRLDERGIEIPFPRLVMYSRQEEE
jgi:moderate conductance mechanosensitive channel